MHDVPAFAPAGPAEREAGLDVAAPLRSSAYADAPRGVAWEVRAICAPYAGVQLTVTDGLVRIAASHTDGFDIVLSSLGDAWLLALGAWHDELVSIDAALEYVALAVSGAIRLKIETCRGKPRRWVVQRRQADGSWLDETDMAVPSLWPWGQKATIYRQNRFSLRDGQPNAAA